MLNLWQGLRCHDWPELDQANREVSTRFDFKGSGAQFSIEEDTVRLEAESEFQLQQIRYKTQEEAELGIRGEHNISNACAAALAARLLGISLPAACEGKPLIETLVPSKPVSTMTAPHAQLQGGSVVEGPTGDGRRQRPLRHPLPRRQLPAPGPDPQRPGRDLDPVGLRRTSRCWRAPRGPR